MKTIQIVSILKIHADSGKIIQNFRNLGESQIVLNSCIFVTGSKKLESLSLESSFFVYSG